MVCADARLLLTEADASQSHTRGSFADGTGYHERIDLA